MEAEKKVCPSCGSENYNSVPTSGAGFIAAYQCGACEIIHMIVSKETYAAWRDGRNIIHDSRVEITSDPRAAHASDRREAKPL